MINKFQSTIDNLYIFETQDKYEWIPIYGLLNVGILKVKHSFITIKKIY